MKPANSESLAVSSSVVNYQMEPVRPKKKKNDKKSSNESYQQP